LDVLPGQSTPPVNIQLDSDEEDMSDDNQPPARPVKPKDTNNNQPASRSNTGPNRIATISSLQNQDKETPHGQAFYAGGSEHSGQQVLGPDGRKGDSEKIVTEMFKQAKENAEVVDRAQQSNLPGPSPFTGAGFTLGSTLNDSRKVGGPSTSKKTTAEEVDDEEEQEIMLKLWQNGFSIDDGPLRAYEEPQNREFLAAIRRGEIPSELSTGRSREVCLGMEDRRHEDYQPPAKKPQKAFTGEGHRLGTPASEIIAQSAAALPNDQASKDKAAADANAFLNVDPAQPNTKIQIRLADGSRMIVNINLSRLVSDLRQYICIARPEYAVIPFNLMTTFPNKVIDNESASIQDSGLANSSLVQRLV